MASKSAAPKAAAAVDSGAFGLMAVPLTGSDLVARLHNPDAAVTYHVMDGGFAAFSGIGSVLGLLGYGLGLRRRYPLAVCSGTAALVFGAAGALVGIGGLQAAQKKNDPAFPSWDAEGIAMRAQGMQHNPRVRLLDAAHWGGAAAAAAALLAAGGSPLRLGYSAGVLGVGQVLSQGSGVGALLAISLIAADKRREVQMEKELGLDD